MRQVWKVAAGAMALALLAGCGAGARLPIAPVSAAKNSFDAAAKLATSPEAEKLIAEYQKVSGSDEAAMAKRIELAKALGLTDTDAALAFLKGQAKGLSAAPEAGRAALENAIAEAIDTLDTYDAELDEPILAAGPGATGTAQATAYAEAMRRKKRHIGLVEWVVTPFKWVGSGLEMLFNGLTGKKPRKKRRRKPSTPSYDVPSYDPMTPAGGYGYR